MKRNILIISFLIATLIFSSCSVTNNYSKGRKYSSANGRQIILKKHIINAATYTQNEDYAMAILEYQESLRYSQDPVIYYNIAKLYYQLEKFQSAIENCNISIKLQKDYVDAYDLLSKIYYQNGEFKELLTSYKKIYSLAPNEENTYLLATLFEFNRDYKNSKKLFEEVYLKYNSYKAGTKLIEHYSVLNNSVKIKEIGLKIYFSQPKNKELSEYLINIFFNNKDYESINIMLDSMQKVLPNELIEFNLYIIADKIKNNPKKLNRDFVNSFLEKIEKNFNTSVGLLFRAGLLADDIGDSIKSDKFYYSLLNVKDADSTLSLVVASEYLRKGKYKQATKVLKLGIDRFPNTLALYSMLANVYQMQNNLQKAKIIIKKSFDIDSTNSDNWTIYADILLLLKDYENAFIAYEHAIANSGKNYTAYNNYAYALSEKKVDLDYAEQMSRLAVNNKETPHFLDTYAWIQYLKQNYNIAQQYMIKAIEIADKELDPIFYEHLADIQVKLNLNKNALQNYNESIKRGSVNKLDILNKIKKINDKK